MCEVINMLSILFYPICYKVLLLIVCVFSLYIIIFFIDIMYRLSFCHDVIYIWFIV